MPLSKKEEKNFFPPFLTMALILQFFLKGFALHFVMSMTVDGLQIFLIHYLPPSLKVLFTRFSMRKVSFSCETRCYLILKAGTNADIHKKLHKSYFYFLCLIFPGCNTIIPTVLYLVTGVLKVCNLHTII